MHAAIPSIGSVVFDCRDAQTLSRFWMKLLDTEIEMSFPGFIWLKPQREGGIAFAFQEVPNPTPGKNRIHLDGHHSDLDAMTSRVAELGGSFVESHRVPGFVWRIYADPERNVFCVGHEEETTA